MVGGGGGGEARSGDDGFCNGRHKQYTIVLSTINYSFLNSGESLLLLLLLVYYYLKTNGEINGRYSIVYNWRINKIISQNIPIYKQYD